jgi:hypothetical protein
MKELVYQWVFKTQDALLCHILDAAAFRNDNCNELMWATHMIHRRAEKCIEAEVVILNIYCKSMNKNFTSTSLLSLIF